MPQYLRFKNKIEVNDKRINNKQKNTIHKIYTLNHLGIFDIKTRFNKIFHTIQSEVTIQSF